MYSWFFIHNKTWKEQWKAVPRGSPVLPILATSLMNWLIFAQVYRKVMKFKFPAMVQGFLRDWARRAYVNWRSVTCTQGLARFITRLLNWPLLRWRSLRAGCHSFCQQNCHWISCHRGCWHAKKNLLLVETHFPRLKGNLTDLLADLQSKTCFHNSSANFWDSDRYLLPPPPSLMRHCSLQASSSCSLEEPPDQAES